MAFDELLRSLDGAREEGGVLDEPKFDDKGLEKSEVADSVLVCGSV